MNPVRLVARREYTERVREKSFLISTGITLAIVVLVVVLPSLLGFGGPSSYTVAATDPQGQAIAEQAVALSDEFDVELTVTGESADVTLSGTTIRSDGPADDELVNVLQVANQQLGARTVPPLEVVSAEPEDPDREAKAGLAFFAILVLYGQLLTYGYWVASGVVEEKASRVIEVLLATIRPVHLLAGKVIGLGYAFYAAAFAVAGALVPRQEELQSSTTPLTMLILVSLFAGFAVSENPEGTLAHVTAFIPPMAPVTMPSRILLGAAPAWEIAASVAVMILATVLLIPLAGRIYSAVVLRTGSAVKLSEALRLARRA